MASTGFRELLNDSRRIAPAIINSRPANVRTLRPYLRSRSMDRGGWPVEMSHDYEIS